VCLFGRAQLANVVPSIAARQRKLDDARGHGSIIALNPARVKPLGLLGRGTADSRNQGESHNARALKDR
jgi:hypothetical protein